MSAPAQKKSEPVAGVVVVRANGSPVSPAKASPAIGSDAFGEVK
jgi:hypothetical protein